jgi:hypothetical protein
MNGNIIQRRNLWVMALLLFITGGFYFFYWLYVTKKEINALGGHIPSLWFAIFPFLNIYFDYQYAKEYVRIILKEDNTNAVILYFLLIFFLPIIAPLVIQYDLNKLV